MLQAQSCAPLLRGGDITAVSLAATGVLHGMAFVENEDSVEIGTQPIDDLPDARNLLPPLVGA